MVGLSILGKVKNLGALKLEIDCGEYIKGYLITISMEYTLSLSTSQSNLSPIQVKVGKWCEYGKQQVMVCITHFGIIA